MRKILALTAALLFTLPAFAAGTETPAEAPRFAAVVAQRYVATLRVLANKLPDDFKALTAQIDGVEKGEGAEDAKHARVAELVAELRKKYRYKIPYAGDEAQVALLMQLANFYDTVLVREGAAACGVFAVNGSGVLVENGVAGDYAALIDAQSAAYFSAVASAFDKPAFHGEAKQADWKAVLDAMVATGAPEPFVKALGTTDPKDPVRCPAMSAMFRTAAVLDGPAAAKVRSNLAQNATGY